MKIRTGFVSNSSTTSFMLMGVRCDEYDLENNEQFMELVKSSNYYDEKEDLSENIYSMINTTDLIVECNYEGTVWIGLSIFSMEDDETLKDFKKRAKYELNRVGINSEVEWHLEAWRDG